MTYKMYCIVSEEALRQTVDEKGNFVLGKFGTQNGHAYLHAWWDSFDRFPEDAMAYKNSPHAFKITTKVARTDELRAFADRYRDICGVTVVTDAGFTVYNGATTTCVCIGPIHTDKIGQDIKDLKLLRKVPK